MCTDAIIAARLGGDEFIILLPGGHDDAGSTAERLISVVQMPFRYHVSPVVAGASTGIASYPEHGKDPSTIMSAADLTLYRSKASGKGRSVHFRPAFREAQQQLLRFEHELETAVRQQLGCEALLRWQHPVRGLLLPAGFTDMLVNSPLSVVLGNWIVRTALAQVREWQACNGLESVLCESAGGDAALVELEVDELLLAELVQDRPAQLDRGNKAYGRPVRYRSSRTDAGRHQPAAARLCQRS